MMGTVRTGNPLNDLHLCEAAFPHVVCSFVVKQTLHRREGLSGAQLKRNG